MSIKKMKIYSMLLNDDKMVAKNVELEWAKYFNFNHKIISPKEIDNIKNKKVDILFVSDRYFDKLSNALIKNLIDKNNQFNFVVISDKDNNKDNIVHFLKNYVDHIIYRDFDAEVVKWKSIAILRRYWNTYAKPTTLMYKNIIADFVENKVSVNGLDIDLTTKELKILWYFMNAIGEYIAKDKLFKKVWEVNDSDSTRVLNQMIFKLKNKLGKEYFHTKRLKGIKFE